MRPKKNDLVKKGIYHERYSQQSSTPSLKQLRNNSNAAIGSGARITTRLPPQIPSQAKGGGGGGGGEHMFFIQQQQQPPALPSQASIDSFKRAKTLVVGLRRLDGDDNDDATRQTREQQQQQQHPSSSRSSSASSGGGGSRERGRSRRKPSPKLAARVSPGLADSILRIGRQHQKAAAASKSSSSSLASSSSNTSTLTRSASAERKREAAATAGRNI
eukprot:jgi/Bigna1/81833/fgenesh1_pg.84_\